MSAASNVSRRDFLRIAPPAGAGLVLGFYLPARPEDWAASLVPEKTFQPNAWLQITPDDEVKLWVGKSELGQGVRTSLPQILADELEADWSKVEIVQAVFDPKYGEQGTGGSTSVRTSWEPLRKAGATAREMLRAAAAKMWGVDVAGCHAEKGTVVHAPSARHRTYGELAATAAELPVPKDVPLKDPKEFRLIGTSVSRTDIPTKVNGSATFGLDVRLPGMVYATVARCPVFGGKVASFDAAKARAVPGVQQVVPIRRGVGVVAQNTWAAIKGREALDVQWDEGPHAGESSDDLRKQFFEVTGKPAHAFRNDGDAEAALARAAKRVEAFYELPFLAHASMEPMNCVAHVEKDRCTIWAPTQSPEWVHRASQRATGLPPEVIRVNVTLSGGGFGRRWFPDEVEEAAEISKLVSAPVHVVWTREDDMRHDYYRPASFHRMTAGLDAGGWPIAWLHRFASTSILGYLQPDNKNPEAIELDGAVDFPYSVPNVRVEYAPIGSGVPRGWLRSVEHTFNAFVVQSFLDELATAAGKDAYEYRLHLLREPRKIPYPGESLVQDTARLRNVLELAAMKAGWGKPLPKGWGRGLALHFSFATYVAEVAEVSVAQEGAVRVHRVVCAVDCGRVVNPDGAKAQIEGGVVYGLTAALKGVITIAKGRAQQSNFHDYPMLRMNEMPVVEVYFVPSTAPPTGTGEPAVPPIAPSVVNAIFAATGRRIRQLPIRPEALAT